MGTAVYSAHQVSLIFAGIPIESGRGPDEFIAIAKANDTYTFQAGVDGDGVFSEDLNNYHTVTVTMMATAKGNAVFSAIHLGDIKTRSGAGIVPILIRDKNGTDVFIASEARIIKWPDESKGKEAGTFQWVIGVPNPQRFLGGH